MTRTFSFVAALIATLLLLTASVLGQNQQDIASSGGAVTYPNPQSVGAALGNLPEADHLVYINLQRILNDAVPRFMTEAEVARMREGFGDVKQFVGVDPAALDYAVIALRFRKPSSDLSFVPPDFMVLTSGDFSAESLITSARLSLQDKIRDEKYGSQTLSRMTIDPLVEESKKNPFLKSFTEVGLVALNPNTIAVGSVAYLKAAIDASDGQGRISPQFINSLLRDQNALISFAGSPWASFARSLGLLGTEGNPRAAACDSRLGDFYAAIMMDATSFKLRGAMNADNPDTAKIMSNLLAALLKTATGQSVDGESAESIMKAVNFAAIDNEVVVQADIPQQQVIDFVKEQLKPKPAAVKAPAKKPATKPRRRTNRRKG